MKSKILSVLLVGFVLITFPKVTLALTAADTTADAYNSSSENSVQAEERPPSMVAPSQINATNPQAIRAEIERLQKVIRSLKAQLEGLERPTLEKPKLEKPTLGKPVKEKFCYNFNRNLRNTDRGEEVKALNKALDKEGLSSTSSSAVDSFSEQSVRKFQQKYASEILHPLGLSESTGFVGPSTRAKLNRLYKCGIREPKREQDNLQESNVKKVPSLQESKPKPEPKPQPKSLPKDAVSADINTDGIVSMNDLLFLLSNWGPCTTEDNCRADLNSDAEVGGSDLSVVTALWGTNGIFYPALIDLNQDGVIDMSDLNLLLSNWGTCGVVNPTTTSCIGDSNLDGKVNTVDLKLLLAFWTQGQAPSLDSIQIPGQ